MSKPNLTSLTTLRSKREEIDTKVAALTAERAQIEADFDEGLGAAFASLTEIFQSLIGTGAKPKGKTVKQES